VSVTSAASAVSDGFVIAKRNLIKIKRVPDLLVGTTLAPIIFVVMFGYVFGGAVAVQGSSYRVFLMAGIFTQTVVFGSTITGTGLAMDIQTGIIDRFRSLPMSPSAVLFGRTLSDLVNNVLVVIVMSLTGLAIGWRISSSFLEALGGFMILLAFAYAFSWIMAMVGLLVPSPEVVNNASFVVIFPVTFVANTFVPLNTLPGPLRSFAEWNPCLERDRGSASALRQHPPRHTGPQRLGPTTSPDLHPGVVRRHPCHLLPVDDTSVPPLGESLISRHTVWR
jgi:ABC transporter DrrB family efflux protein